MGECSDKLYDQVFKKWISGNDVKFSTWKQEKIERGKMKDQIKALLEKGFKVKTGYTCSSIRGVHNYHIFYK